MGSIAVNRFIKTLKKDKELRRAFHDNIAMAFKDNYQWHKKKTGKKVMSNEDIHIIGNNGADYFLKLLCDEFKTPAGR
jgi:hypothetical protein